MGDKDLTEDEKRAIRMNKVYTENVPLSAMAIYSIFDEQPEITALIDQVTELTESVLNGDDTKIKSALITQSKTLGVIFNNMITKAVKAPTMEGFKIFMDVALRAQNQCRKTLLALDAIQHPQQQTVVRQQNIAVNQQVNNEVSEKKTKKRTDKRG